MLSTPFMLGAAADGAGVGIGAGVGTGARVFPGASGAGVGAVTGAGVGGASPGGSGMEVGAGVFGMREVGLNTGVWVGGPTSVGDNAGAGPGVAICPPTGGGEMTGAMVMEGCDGARRADGLGVPLGVKATGDDVVVRPGGAVTVGGVPGNTGVAVLGAAPGWRVVGAADGTVRSKAAVGVNVDTSDVAEGAATGDTEGVFGVVGLAIGVPVGAGGGEGIMGIGCGVGVAGTGCSVVGEAGEGACTAG